MEKNKEVRTKEALERLKHLDDLLQERLQKTTVAMQEAQAVGHAIAKLKKQSAI
jgi:hypothetical protein